MSSGATSLHEILRDLRESRGQSLREAARDLEVDPAYLSRIERGTKPASPAVLERASAYYNVPEELLSLSRGVVPADVTAILQSHPELLDELRRRYGSG
jgi:transcriptional regulator with XRE-family HTH domain